MFQAHPIIWNDSLSNAFDASINRTKTYELLDTYYSTVSTSKVLHIIVEECSLNPTCNSEVIEYSDCKDIIVLSKILLKCSIIACAGHI